MIGHIEVHGIFGMSSWVVQFTFNDLKVGVDKSRIQKPFDICIGVENRTATSEVF